MQAWHKQRNHKTSHLHYNFIVILVNTSSTMNIQQPRQTELPKLETVKLIETGRRPGLVKAPKACPQHGQSWTSRCRDVIASVTLRSHLWSCYFTFFNNGLFSYTLKVTLRETPKYNHLLPSRKHLFPFKHFYYSLFRSLLLFLVIYWHSWNLVSRASPRKKLIKVHNNHSSHRSEYLCSNSCFNHLHRSHQKKAFKISFLYPDFWFPNRNLPLIRQSPQPLNSAGWELHMHPALLPACQSSVPHSPHSKLPLSASYFKNDEWDIQKYSPPSKGLTMTALT